MTLSNLSREQKIYLALWRKASRENKLVEINLDSYNQALSMRMAMYRTIKPYREEILIDPELQLAAESFVLSVKKGSKVLVIQPRGTLSAAEQAMYDLGITEEDLMSPEEKEIKERLEKELNDLVEPGSKPEENPNPFYSRDDR